MRHFEANLDYISKGLRPLQSTKYNLPYLVQSVGAIPREGLLVSLEQLSKLDVSSLPAQSFPFPQFFVLSGCTIVCTPGSIYEVDGVELAQKITGLPAGSTWSVVDFVTFVYLTNGSVAVVRDPDDCEFKISTELPFGTCLCDFGGQVLVGSPNCELPEGGI